MTEAEVAAMKKEIMDGVTATVTGLIKPLTEAQKALGDNQKVLADTMAADAEAKKAAAAATAAKEAADKAAAAGAGGGDKDKPLTRAELDALLAEREKAGRATAEQAAARNNFVAEKMKDLPEVYQAKLGADPTKWAAEEQAIREAAKADAAKMGFVPKDVGGNQGGAGGGAGGGGGGAPAGNVEAQALAKGLTVGQFKYAQELKLPGAPAATAAAK